MEQKRIYVDNAAATPVSRAALTAMLPYFAERFGNPSASHSYGQEAKRALEDSRRIIARLIGALNNEVFFTSGGTEGDNWILQSVCEQYAHKGRHIISTKIEHNAVLRPLERLGSRGFTVTLLEPDTAGMIYPDQLRKALRDDTILVSVMAANNVVGTLLPVKELCAIAHERQALFHTDAVQAAAHIPLQVRSLGVDFLTLSAHKFHGPKGIGALYAHLPLTPVPLIAGGGQEKGRRAGTENVSAIAGMAAALEEGVQNLAENMKALSALRDKLITEFLKLPNVLLTGDREKRLPGLASFIFEDLEGQDLVARLDEAGICASSGAACSTGSIEPSHVLTAMGYVPQISRGALRISLSHYNTEAEIDRIIEKLPGIVEKLRMKRRRL
ncbi:MAG: cysteine desulfurase [Treponema sp.]|jgi:cysteine desulfurase|nr:cysteine desulfurase [Treponema sp.]